ncbi:TetR/AcrR family transcriptional regulator [Streptomyces olivochromogenes]|uniref:TetR/AcrR family transcriptional regulator n=1 Tax=Streptomyces olivochromogenes TaxID=1963 RepID=UPI001F1AA20D|nr:TetR/AcrR family transcriptional regulator [Streptomyces olivochromogenes]MCF3130418.1 TetR/AcrR family transcriptional regulator [Streptomyces olivochromogenes]
MPATPSALNDPARPSEARDRLLATAERLFYGEGIRAVGVDKVIAEAQVTRATFYRHFPGKEDLVTAYLTGRDNAIRAGVAAGARQAADSHGLLTLLVEGIGQEVCSPGFRGCPFINAAAEYPDPDSPVHQAVLTHRAWFRQTLVDAFGAEGHPDPEQAADIAVALRDGAMVAGYLGDPEAARNTLARGTEVLLAAAR